MSGAPPSKLAIEPAGEPRRRVALPSSGVLIVGNEAGSAGLVLRAEGVARTHVAIAPLKGGGHGVKLIAESAGAALNGRPIKSARLNLGDELQLGAARLLVVDTETGSHSDGLGSGGLSTIGPGSVGLGSGGLGSGGSGSGGSGSGGLGSGGHSSSGLGSGGGSDRAGGQTLRADLIPGFRLIESLGRGAVGRVVLAHQENLDRRVAIKLLDKRHASDEQFVARFRDEARAAAALHHANVVTVFDVGEAEGQPYLVMEYMGRGSLEDRLRKEGALPWRAVLGVLRDAAAGLEFAAAKGIVHRDVKPANLMQTAAGETKIADLGLATSNFAGVGGQSGKIQGTPHFMAPEQARGEVLDERADLYGLGASAWRLLTARTPFSGEDARAILRAAQTEEPDPPSLHADGIPAAVDALVLELMSKSPDDRPRSAALLKARIDLLISGNGSGNGAGIGGRADGSRSRLPLVGLGAALLLGVGGAALAVFGPWGADEGGPPLGPDGAASGPAIPDGVVETMGPVLPGGIGPELPPPEPEPNEEGAMRRLEKDAAAALAQALTIVEPEGRADALADVVEEFLGTEAGNQAVLELRTLQAEAGDSVVAASGALEPERGASDPAAGDNQLLDALIDDLAQLCRDEEGELLPPRIGLAAVTEAPLPTGFLVPAPGQVDAGPAAFEERRSALLEELRAAVAENVSARLDEVRAAVTAGEFESAGTELSGLREWLLTEPEQVEDGASAGAPAEAEAPASEPVAEDGADRAVDEEADAPVEQGEAAALDSDFDAFLSPLLERVDDFTAALPRLELDYREFVRQTDRVHIADALGPGEEPTGFKQTLQSGEFAAAAARAAELAHQLGHPPYIAAAERLAAQLNAAARFGPLLRETWNASEWKRKRVQLPGQGAEFAEAVSVDARGISVEQDGGSTMLLEWARFAEDPAAVLRLFEDRLVRAWSADEKATLEGVLLAATWSATLDDIAKALTRGGLLGSGARALAERLQPAQEFAEGPASPEFRAQLRAEADALGEITEALTAAEDEDWASAVFALEQLFERASETTFVWLLADGRPAGEPAVWPPAEWPDRPSETPAPPR